MDIVVGYGGQLQKEFDFINVDDRVNNCRLSWQNKWKLFNIRNDVFLEEAKTETNIDMQIVMGDGPTVVNNTFKSPET